MRFHRTLTAAALLLGIALATPVPQADAKTIAPLTIEQLTDASTYIVEGKVERVWVEVDAKEQVWTRALVRIDTLFKGPADTGATIVIDALGGHAWNVSTYQELQPRFSVGEHVLVFLDVIRDERIVPAAAFHGKFTIRRAPEDTEKHAMRWISRPNAPYDAQFLPYPPAERRIYVDDLRGQIEARLEAGWDGESIPGISEERLREINGADRTTPRTGIEVSR